VKNLRLFVLTAALLTSSSLVRTQECTSFENSQSQDLVSFLNGVVPDDKNAVCVNLAIKKLGEARYPSAAPVLVHLLDFKRPPLTESEKQGFSVRMPSIWEWYPATTALELIGTDALPSLLNVMRAEATTPLAREHAIAVWMEIYKYDKKGGVGHLKQEHDKTTDSAGKERMKAALLRAVRWCGEDEGVACKQAAEATPSR
jgi:hypothetical protein